VFEQFLTGSRQSLSIELFEKIVQCLRQHELFEKIVRLYDGLQANLPQFTPNASDCIITAMLRSKVEFTSISRLSPSLSSLIQILNAGSKRTISSVNFLEKLLEIKNAPTAADFLDLLTGLDKFTNFETFWPCFRHFVQVGAAINAPIIDLACHYLQQFESYDDVSFLINTARDSAIPMSRNLFSAGMQLALSFGNLGDALALREEMEAAQLTPVEDAERRYTEVFSQIQDVIPAEPGQVKRAKPRPRSRTFPRTDLLKWQAHS
jgi:hypothetical protein